MKKSYAIMGVSVAALVATGMYMTTSGQAPAAINTAPVTTGASADLAQSQTVLAEEAVLASGEVSETPAIVRTVSLTESRSTPINSRVTTTSSASTLGTVPVAAAPMETQTPAGVSPFGGADRASSLAWTIAAYVPCDDALSLEAGFLREIAKMDLTEAEILSALRMLETEELVCPSVQSFAGNLLKTAGEDSSQFRLMVGIAPVETADRATPAPNLQAKASASQTSKNAGGTQSAVPSPPLNSSMQSTSDY